MGQHGQEIGVLSLRQKEKGPIGPLLFLKAIAGDEKPPGFDQTQPQARLEPSRKAAQPCKGRISQR